MAVRSAPDSDRLAIDRLPYRVGVGVMLINRRGEIWVGRRRPRWLHARDGAFWQMPQGGVDSAETPRTAALRELHEETGIRRADIVGEHPEWLTYELPPSLLGVALKGRYRGQRQRWFAASFLGEDDEVDIGGCGGMKAEFDRWRWAAPKDLAALTVGHKQALYRRLVSHFAPLLG